MQLADGFRAEWRSVVEQLSQLELLVTEEASSGTLRRAVTAMRGSIEAHAEEGERLFRERDPAAGDDEPTLAELKADHGRIGLLLREIERAQGLHLRNLCRTLVGLLRHHLAEEERLLLPLPDGALAEPLPAT